MKKKSASVFGIIPPLILIIILYFVMCFMSYFVIQDNKTIILKEQKIVHNTLNKPKGEI